MAAPQSDTEEDVVQSVVEQPELKESEEPNPTKGNVADETPFDSWPTTIVIKFALVSASIVSSFITVLNYCKDKCVSIIFYLINCAILVNAGFFQIVAYYNDSSNGFTLLLGLIHLVLAIVLIVVLYTTEKDTKDPFKKKLQTVNIAVIVINFVLIVIMIGNEVIKNPTVKAKFSSIKIEPTETAQRGKEWIKTKYQKIKDWKKKPEERIVTVESGDQ